MPICKWDGHLLSGKLINFITSLIMMVTISKSGTARANFLWRDSEQWALFKHVVQYLCASPCYRIAITNSMIHAGWSQATHTANVVLDFWHDTFDSCVIWNWFSGHFACGQNWPLNSPDLNPCNCFILGFLKENTFLKKPWTVMKLRALIMQTCNLLSSQQYHSSCWKLSDVVVVILKLDSG
jgi:hypothetical protein